MTTTIKLTRGKVALIDDDDFELVSKFKWSAHHRRIGATWYARTNVGSWPNQSPVYLHRLVMNASGGQIVDHIDGNGLNCQKDNLRICTHSQNQHNSGIRRNNTSGYIGVDVESDATPVEPSEREFVEAMGWNR